LCYLLSGGADFKEDFPVWLSFCGNSSFAAYRQIEKFADHGNGRLPA